jgi:signal transduction histidine kinase
MVWESEAASPSDARHVSGAYARLSGWVLGLERYLRTHPSFVGALTIISMAGLAVVSARRLGSSLPVALTYAFPIALATYGLGFIVGTFTAFAASALWTLGAIHSGIAHEGATFVFFIRSLNNFGVVLMASLLAAVARARERFSEGQRELTELQEDLVSAFSHDLRSPLAAITGYAEMLRDGLAGTPPEEAEDILKRILVNAERLDRLVADMLEARKAELTTPQVESVDPSELLAELRAEFAYSDRARNVTQRWEVTPGTPPLQTDRSKVASILRNLVNNAIKFTPHGTVAVRIDFDRGSGMHRIQVEDTGTGIPAGALDHIFDRFYRAREVARVSGFGFGLFIVKRFADILGGHIGVQSEVGHGTRFTVTLPRLPQTDRGE